MERRWPRTCWSTPSGERGGPCPSARDRAPVGGNPAGTPAGARRCPAPRYRRGGRLLAFRRMEDGVYVGNAGKDAALDRGWLLGHFKEEGSPLHSDAVEVKWGVHPRGEQRAQWVKGEVRAALLVLISGRFRMEFPGEACCWKNRATMSSGARSGSLLDRGGRVRGTDSALAFCAWIRRSAGGRAGRFVRPGGAPRTGRARPNMRHSLPVTVFRRTPGKTCEVVQPLFPYGGFVGLFFGVGVLCGVAECRVLTCPETVIDDYGRVTEFRKGIRECRKKT